MGCIYSSLKLKTAKAAYAAEYGWTALHSETWDGKVSAVRDLLRQGADVNARDKVSHSGVSGHFKSESDSLPSLGSS